MLFPLINTVFPGWSPHLLRSRTAARKGGRYRVRVLLRESGEMFTVPGCSRHMLVGELAEALELVAGIPIHLQRLSYLDGGDMPADTTFQFNGIIPGATISLRIWHYDGWSDLVKAAIEGNLEKVLSLGVTADSTFSTLNSERLTPKQRRDWLARRAGVALYIVSHRDHRDIVLFLLKNGANVQSRTPLWTTPLHVAAAMGNTGSMDPLLAHGAQIHIPNRRGLTPLDLAEQLGQKKIERVLFLYQWMQRAKTVTLKSHLDPTELFAHQMFDSKLKTWRCGSHAKRYMMHLGRHTEFRGSTIGAPQRLCHRRRQMDQGNLNA
ncbi:ankyrin repeat domain-containing protein 60 [Ascaphus truei]|uniref:ankyrin repeat domain-containing protein 60 n=1 Tax=Ascaphus truei TaxID=8439 RepID=UPI003F5A29F3